MAGLDTNGFTPLTEQEIFDQIEARFRLIEPNYDLSEDSLDGQAVRAMAYQTGLLWNALGAVYDSFDPNLASGQALKNLGLLTGIDRDKATKGTAFVQFSGGVGASVPKGTLVADDDGVEYETVVATKIFAAGLSELVEVVCTVTGKFDISAGRITTIISPYPALASVNQAYDGIQGVTQLTESAFRNLRQKTVLRNHTDTADVLSSRLYELGVEQVFVLNNSDPTNTIEGIPPRTLGVFINPGDSLATDEEIAQIIQNTKGLACPTAGSTSVVVKDSQGHDQVINFTKTTPVDVTVVMNITFLDVDSAGAEAKIRTAITDHINSLPAGQDVIWSHMFALITPYGNAQVNTMQIGKVGEALNIINIPIASAENASITPDKVVITAV